MQETILQIQKALDAEAFYPALFVAIALPDICGALESENGLSTGAKYQTWFDQFVANKYNGNLPGDIAYILRCSLLHQGTFVHPRQIYTRIIFQEPIGGIVFHNGIANGTLILNPVEFCNDIIAGIQTWLPIVEMSPNFIANYANMIKRYPNGIPPFLVGCSVIS